jgi:hypothetical protein
VAAAPDEAAVLLAGPEALAEPEGAASATSAPESGSPEADPPEAD